MKNSLHQNRRRQSSPASVPVRGPAFGLSPSGSGLRRVVLGGLNVLALWAAASTPALAQEQLQVTEARQALARGAVVWDLRGAGAVLPGAARIAPGALRAWLENADTEALSQAVSEVGLNLSAEVLLVAEDDTTAQAVAERLRPLARGRVAWLAGGTAAWQAAGLPLDQAPTRRLPMPQRLTPAAPADQALSAQAHPAAAARRATATYGLSALVTAVLPAPVRN